MASGSAPYLPPSSDAAVLLFDVSRSMFVRGYYPAVREAAIALYALIREQYPHIALYLVPFSYYAREIQSEDLPNWTWEE
jgi:uncharacterized protein with von Willebrand factor type A (vWA) domain